MLPGIMQTGKNVGMITMDESLKRLYIEGVITPGEALFRANDKAEMKAFFQS
jgi:twitching motility protein PilT